MQEDRVNGSSDFLVIEWKLSSSFVSKVIREVSADHFYSMSAHCSSVMNSFISLFEGFLTPYCIACQVRHVRPTFRF